MHFHWSYSHQTFTVAGPKIRIDQMGCFPCKKNGGVLGKSARTRYVHTTSKCFVFVNAIHDLSLHAPNTCTAAVCVNFHSIFHSPSFPFIFVVVVVVRPILIFLNSSFLHPLSMIYIGAGAWCCIRTLMHSD